MPSITSVSVEPQLPTALRRDIPRQFYTVRKDNVENTGEISLTQ